MDDGEWILVEQAGEKDRWRPTSKDASPTPKPLKIVFAAPAKHWTDALPIGNGRLGAMVWGGVPSELIQLNEDTLWTGTPGNYTNPQAPKALADVRKLVDAGQYSEATTEAAKLSGDPSDVYQPLGDIKLDFDDFHFAYESYQRELDLDTSTVKIKYQAGGVVFTREHFASYPDQVIVTRIAGSKPGSLSCTVYLDSKLTFQSRVKSSTQIVMEGTCPGKRVPPKADQEDNPKGIQFSAVLSLQISESRGSTEVLDGNKLKITGSDWVVLMLTACSSFDGPFTKPSDSVKHPTSECLRTMEVIKTMSYFDLYARHLDDYQKLFRRVSLHLSRTSNNFVEKMKENEVPTSESVKSFQSDQDPSLVELLFQYGRYLLISCSRPGSQASNLQGIWNKDIEPAWDCAPHLNINLQMNYWPCLPCNLRECQEPLFDYITSLSINGQKTAEVNYEARGWVVHQVSDIWAKTSPDRGEAVWALWPMGGAWICTHLWEHYQYTSDKGFLEKKAFPLMEGCAEFLLDWLIEGPGGFLETNPSTSPEHMFIQPNGKTASVSYSSTMDISIIKEVFSAVISAAEVLKNTSSIVQKVLAARAKLPPTKIARDGSIMEWALDFEDPDLHHRHLSHLFGLFPGHTITREQTPDLCKAAAYSLYKRGEESPGWSTTWKAALYARLRSSENAYRMIKHLFNLVDPDRESDFEGGLYANLFAAHPPFQIDANFGFAAAIAEMLVQSTTTDLYLLPALPRDKWPDGCVKGLKARGGITVNICWTAGDLHQVGLWSIHCDCLLTLHYGGKASVSKLLAGRVYTFDNLLKCVKTAS